jgi:hypothetical protein
LGFEAALIREFVDGRSSGASASSVDARMDPAVGMGLAVPRENSGWGFAVSNRCDTKGSVPLKYQFL